MHAAALDGTSCRGNSLVYRRIRIAGCHVDLVERHVEFLGHNLRQRRYHAGAEFDFAGEDGDVPSFAMAIQESRDLGSMPSIRKAVALGQRARCGAEKAEADDQGAGALKKISAGDGFVSMFGSPSSGFHAVRRALNGADHPQVRAAAANITVQRLLDVRDGRMRIFVQQGFRAHDHAVHAVAALRGLLLNERGLQRVRMGDAAQAFESGDVSFLRGGNREDAGAHGVAFHQHGARAACAEAAAEARPVQLRVVAQDIQQRGAGSASTTRALPFTLSEICAMVPFLSQRAGPMGWEPLLAIHEFEHQKG